ncbi:hypothetical protein F5B17DRAFT_451742 [Nemania serpens]|nr:hypothetical protein F5B17DRAFT_451742 [Nemania serpens]
MLLIFTRWIWTADMAATCTIIAIITPVSVNYHFTRKCNKECGFCFHTEKTSYIASEDQMKHGLYLLKKADMRKINFAGGEPFLYPKKLAMLCRFCKEELGLESVSIITNGTKVTKKWLEQNGRWIDVLGVSCDSFNEQTNIAIGRGTGNNVRQLFNIRDWCQKLGIKFKLNTVVCIYNWDEDMADTIQKLNPFKFKAFQALYVEGENDAEENDVELNKRKRNAKKLLISNEQFKVFCDKHRHLESFVPEPNSIMASSYLILDEALREILWDQEAFKERRGLYEWTKDEPEMGGCGSIDQKSLEW